MNRGSGGAKGPYDTYMFGVKVLAYTISVVTTFLGTGPLYAFTAGFVRDYAVHHYGPGMGEPVQFVWGFVCALVIFGFSVASVSTGLIVAAGVVFVRFFAF